MSKDFDNIESVQLQDVEVNSWTFLGLTGNIKNNTINPKFFKNLFFNLFVCITK